MGRASTDIHRSWSFCSLFNLGGVPGFSLYGAGNRLSLAILFAGDIWEFAARVVWSKARLDTLVAAFFACTSNIVGARRISIYLLLLPRGLLQINVG